MADRIAKRRQVYAAEIMPTVVIIGEADRSAARTTTPISPSQPLALGMRPGDMALYHARKAAVAASRGLRDGFPRAPALAVFVAPDRAAFCKVWPPLRALLRGGAPTLVFYKIPVEPFLDA